MALSIHRFCCIFGPSMRGWTTFELHFIGGPQYLDNLQMLTWVCTQISKLNFVYSHKCLHLNYTSAGACFLRTVYVQIGRRSHTVSGLGNTRGLKQ